MKKGQLRRAQPQADLLQDLSLDSSPDDSDDETDHWRAAHHLRVQTDPDVATDPDAVQENTVMWELSGPDASKFSLGRQR